MNRLPVKIAAILLAVFVMVSCFDSREEIWISPDGSGTARITVTVPAFATRLNGGEEGVEKMIVDYLSASPQFSSFNVKSGRAPGGLEFDVIVTFDDVMALGELGESPATEKLPAGSFGFMGETKVGFEGLSVNYSRSVELSKAVPGAVFLPRGQLAGHSVVTIFHLPLAPSSHNAHTVSEDGRTLTWETPLATAFRGPVETTFVMPLPIPWGKIIPGATLLVLLVALLGYYFLRKRKSAVETAGPTQEGHPAPRSSR